MCRAVSKMLVKCSLFLALLLLGRVQCQTTAEPGSQPTATSSSENQRLVDQIERLVSSVAYLTQQVGRCAFVGVFEEQLTQLRNRLTSLEAEIEMKLSDIKQKTETGFVAVQDTLGDLEAEQQKVGGGLETLRSETAQLAVTVGGNITQIKEELSGSFAAVKENLENVTMRQLEMKEGIQELKHGTVEGSITVSYPYIATACSKILTTNHNSPPGYYQLRAPNGTIFTQLCAHSCADIAGVDPSSPPGYYQLLAPNGTITTEYCPMECKKCLAIQSTGGWRRLAYLDMTDPTHQCPSGFRLFTEPRRCSPGTSDSFYGCASVTYAVQGIQYQRVCGRVIAYQKGYTGAFWRGSWSIDIWYVDGVSLTHGSPPNRHHIWTFAAALDEQHVNALSCPCSNTRRGFTGRVPDYVGDDYFCDSGTRVWSSHDGAGFDEVYTEDPLWDGSGCGPTSSCCTFNSPPWFCKELSQPTNDDIELRACRDIYSYRDVQIKLIELYIQ